MTLGIRKLPKSAFPMIGRGTQKDALLLIPPWSSTPVATLQTGACPDRLSNKCGDETRSQFRLDTELLTGRFAPNSAEIVKHQSTGIMCIMRTILQSLLIIAVAFAYVAGPHLTFEMEHAHEVCENHDHNHEHPGDEHSHQPHDHDSTPSPSLPDEGDSEGDSHSHTHVVSLGIDQPFSPASHNALMAHWNRANHPSAISESVPDGPCFPLIKPPQLG
jgi:hypothetical protein